jgi:excisionase family DNA binding protein
MFELRPFEQIPTPNRLFSVRELARYLGVSESWVHKARVHGTAPVATIVGNRVRFAWRDIEKWLATRKSIRTAARLGSHSIKPE